MRVATLSRHPKLQFCCTKNDSPMPRLSLYLPRPNRPPFFLPPLPALGGLTLLVPPPPRAALTGYGSPPLPGMGTLLGPVPANDRACTQQQVPALSDSQAQHPGAALQAVPALMVQRLCASGSCVLCDSLMNTPRSAFLKA